MMGITLENTLTSKRCACFFEFFKKHNHLFKDVSLDCDVIDELELELDSEADTIYNASTGSEEATMAEEQALDY